VTSTNIRLISASPSHRGSSDPPSRAPAAAGDRLAVRISDHEVSSGRGELGRVDRSVVLAAVALHVLPLDGSDEDYDIRVVVVETAQLQHAEQYR
jgi:hypothetical protein